MQSVRKTKGSKNYGDQQSPTQTDFSTSSGNKGQVPKFLQPP